MLLDTFPLEPGETIITTIRQHWFIIATELLMIILLGLAPIIVLTGLASNPEAAEFLSRFESSFPYLLFLVCLWLLMTTFAATAAWTHHFLDLWVLTDRRFIAIEQIGFFNRRVSNLRLERIQDIQAAVSGLIPTLLNFGTLRLQTAGAVENNFVLKHVPAPRELQALIATAASASSTIRTVAPTNPSVDPSPTA